MTERTSNKLVDAYIAGDLCENCLQPTPNRYCKACQFWRCFAMLLSLFAFTDR